MIQGIIWGVLYHKFHESIKNTCYNILIEFILHVIEGIDMDADYEVRWVIPNEVALLVQNRDMTIPQIVTMINEVNQLLESSPHEKLPVIVDGSNMKSTSNNIGDVLKEFRTVRSEKWGFTVVVGAQGVIKFFAQLILQLARVEVRLAKDMDEAIEIIYRVNPSLPRVS